MQKTLSPVLLICLLIPSCGSLPTISEPDLDATICGLSISGEVSDWKSFCSNGKTHEQKELKIVDMNKAVCFPTMKDYNAHRDYHRSSGK